MQQSTATRSDHLVVNLSVDGSDASETPLMWERKCHIIVVYVRKVRSEVKVGRPLRTHTAIRS